MMDPSKRHQEQTNTLAIRRSAVARTARSTKRGQQRDDPKGRRPSSILVVDDDVAVRNSLRWLLESDGYQVVTAANGGQALDLLRQGLRPCLILLDLMMPAVDGWTFRRIQLEDARLSKIPVVVYSDQGDPEGKLRGVVRLAKPFGGEELLKVVDRHCFRR
jgi:CheY-like chemotaxis protein